MLRRTFEDGAYADRALAAEARRAGVRGRELALATRLAYGAVQRCRTLDHVAANLAARSVEDLDPPLRAALRLGLVQLFHLDGVPARAAVHESVELAKEDAPRGAGLVNAVLRRAAREGPPALPDGTAAEAALAHSVPDWLAARWWAWLGPEEARALLRAVNDPPEHALRVNPLRPAELDAIPARPAGDPPEALLLDGPWDAWNAPEWKAGAVFPQSRSSMRVARELAPEPGERVLDLCSAPGGKATHLAALMENAGEVVAVEKNPRRAAELRKTVRRLGATCVRVEEADAAAFRAERPFDRVLLDPPCSGLGTLQTRPDLRWKTSPERIAEAAELQARILERAQAALKPGGVLVYSVCTLSAEEEPDLPWTATRRLLPHRDGSEGFFIARLGGVAD